MDTPAPAPAPTPTVPPKPPTSKYAIMVAMREAKGVRCEAARKLGISDEWLKQRIEDDSQLYQLYGAKSNTTPPPDAVDAMERKPTDLPPTLPNSAMSAVKVISLVSPEDSERLLDGLKQFDFSEKSLERIRSLGSLAADTGRFIAVSLEKTHQNYVVQQFGLMELADEIRRRLLVARDQPDYIADEQTRSALNHNYVEMVRESGRGVKLSIEMAEVITRMLEAVSSKSKAGRTKMGWKKKTAIEVGAETPQTNGEAGP